MLQSFRVPQCCAVSLMLWPIADGFFLLEGIFLIKVKARKIPYETKAFCLQQSAQFCKLHLLKSSLESD